MSEIEHAEVKRILREAGFSERSVEWMAASCPDVELAERYYGEGRSLYLVEEE